MPKKKFSLTEFKKLLKSEALVIGTDRTVKNLKKGNVERVFLSSNCNPTVEHDLNHYASLSKTEIVKLQYPNDELGVICKKPYSISVLALLKLGGK
jgi:large subunit ribosomal protein L30e